MAKADLRADSARDNLIPFPPRPRRLRADVPPFNPADPAHQTAWEAVWDMGQAMQEGRF